MRSMTGYGRYSIELNSRELMIELKSVNHRFLDINVKLPRAHNFADTVIKKAIQKKVVRGHIDVYVTYQDNRDDKYQLKYDNQLATSYVEMAQEMAKAYNITNDYCVASLMRAPDVVEELPIQDDIDIISNMYNDCIANAVDNLNQMRECEGQSLAQEMLSRADTLEDILLMIKARAPEVGKDYREKLTERVKETLQDVVIDENRLLNEVAFFTDKCSIDEEISRLGMHIINFRKLVLSKEPNGRKLDFLVQELNRESNTIGSKANDIELVNNVLLLKAEIEKIREQIQNIE